MIATVWPCPTVAVGVGVGVGAGAGAVPAKFGADFNRKSSDMGLAYTPSINYKCRCFKRELTDKPTETEGFSVLSSEIPWQRGSIWSTMALYMFNLHIPLGIGGLSIVAYALHRPVLDPQTEAASLLVIQLLELIGALLLLKSNGKPEYKVERFFGDNKLSKERNWLLASLLGFGFLWLLVFLTSFLAARFIGPKAVNDPILKEILLSSSIAKVACVIVYCFITPLLEETVYRAFLLTSLASTMNWQQAVFLSSSVFSAAHFSVENFVQLFIVGSVLGCCYCWTGNLSSSLVVHSLYNAMILIITFLS